MDTFFQSISSFLRIIRIILSMAFSNFLALNVCFFAFDALASRPRVVRRTFLNFGAPKPTLRRCQSNPDVRASRWTRIGIIVVHPCSWVSKTRWNKGWHLMIRILYVDMYETCNEHNLVHSGSIHVHLFWDVYMMKKLEINSYNEHIRDSYIHGMYITFSVPFQRSTPKDRVGFSHWLNLGRCRISCRVGNLFWPRTLQLPLLSHRSLRPGFQILDSNHHLWSQKKYERGPLQPRTGDLGFPWFSNVWQVVWTLTSTSEPRFAQWRHSTSWSSCSARCPSLGQPLPGCFGGVQILPFWCLPHVFVT